MKLENLPKELVMKILLYLECPVAKIMKQHIKKYEKAIHIELAPYTGITYICDMYGFDTYYFDRYFGGSIYVDGIDGLIAYYSYR